LGAFVAHLVLPVATLTLTLLAHVTRLTRSSMNRGARQHVREGCPRARIAGATGDPSARAAQCIDPSITVLAQDFGFLIGGIVAVETVFAYPGLGRMLSGRSSVRTCADASGDPGADRGLLPRELNRRPALRRGEPRIRYGGPVG